MSSRALGVCCISKDADQEQTVTGLQAATAQTALRKALGLPPEHFFVQAFIGTISDEIELLRGKGKSDEQIAALIAEAVAVDLSAAQIKAFYASPEARGHHG